MIIEACDYIDHINHTRNTQGTQNQADDDQKNRLFIHLVFHPDDVPRKRIQELYQLHCADLLRDECRIERPTIAYSRPRNLGDYLTKTKLYQAPGESSSTIMGEYKDGLNPL